MPFEIVRNDITKMPVDAIVCVGSRRPGKGYSFNEAVFAAAGPQLEKRRARLSCSPSAVIITPGFNLPAKHIIHTAGPDLACGFVDSERILHICYRKSLAAAARRHAQSVAVPLITTGLFCALKEHAVQIAGAEIRRFLEKYSDTTIYLTVSDADISLLRKSTRENLEAFITEEENHFRIEDRISYSIIEADSPSYAYDNNGLHFSEEDPLPLSLDDALKRREPGFRDLLLSFVEASGRKWPEIYQDAQVTKGVASKIRTQTDYTPSKGTALAFAIALHLNLKDTELLLRSFGRSLSSANRADLIVKYFIQTGNYDRFDLDCALFDHGELCLTNNL